MDIISHVKCQMFEAEDVRRQAFENILILMFCGVVTSSGVVEGNNSIV